MDSLAWNLVLAAAGVGFVHTALGPDHYLPFIMLARARAWSARRTIAVTTACGVAHVAASLVLGGTGLFLGLGLQRLERLESARGGLAAWMLVALGLAYATWGVRKALRRRRGLEPHAHGDHVHLHARGDRAHRHLHTGPDSATTFWSLFAVFVLGPCEPLIPLFVLPASRGRLDAAALAAAVFGLVTVGSMVALTLLGLAGLRPVRLRRLEKWSHSLAGVVIALSGLAILFMGL